MGSLSDYLGLPTVGQISATKTVTARSEWDVDKAILQPLSMTFFLQTKLAALQDDIVMGKFRCLDKTTSELIWDEVGKFFGNVFPTIKERLVSRKILDVSALLISKSYK